MDADPAGVGVEPTAVDIDLSLAWLPFEDEALTAATPVKFGDGIVLATARAEDLVIYKAAAWRERDRTDIERLLSATASRGISRA